MLRIAICDDDSYFCDQLEAMINHLKSELDSNIDIEVFNSGEQLINTLTNSVYFDVIFLDIEFKTMSGIEAGKYIRSVINDDLTQIVYVSGKERYAMQLFETRPFDFLIKPVQPEKIKNILEKIIQINNEGNKFFLIKSKRRIAKIPQKEIIYFESSNRKILLYTIKEAYEFYGKLTDIKSKIDSLNFIFIHKSYLVNFNNVIDYRYDQLKTCNNKILSISQNYKKLVCEYISKYPQWGGKECK